MIIVYAEGGDTLLDRDVFRIVPGEVRDGEGDRSRCEGATRQDGHAKTAQECACDRRR